MTCSVVIYDAQGDSPLYITVTFAPPSKWGGLSFFTSPKTFHSGPGAREASQYYIIITTMSCMHQAGVYLLPRVDPLLLLHYVQYSQTNNNVLFGLVGIDGRF